MSKESVRRKSPTALSQMYEWIKTLAKKDSVEFDLHGCSNENNSIVFQKKDLKNYSYNESQHLNIRVLQGEKSGTSYTKNFSKESLEDCYKRAIAGLKISDKKEAGSLSYGQEYEDFSSFYNSDFQKIPLDKKVEKAREMNQACLDFDSRIQPISSSVQDWKAHIFFTNSKGAGSSYKTNALSCTCMSLAVDGDKRSQSYVNTYSRDYDSVDFKALGEEAAEKTLKKLGYQIPPTKRYPVLFQAGQASGSLLSCLAGMLNGKSLFEGLSLFKDSLGKQIFSENFSFYDDPLADWGFSSCPFDGEGFSSQKTKLAEKGVLSNYLTDSFYAKALGAPHTRKACWNNGKGALDISTTNLLMSEGEASFEELLREFPQVIVIDYLKGFAGYNSISGDFSIESEGFLSEKGEMRPLCQFTVSGNIRDVFSHILKVGRDSQVFAGSIKSPSFLLADLMIAGK